MKDACYRQALASYGKWSARAAQATAKCRKKSGHVRKTAAGANLKRWAAEKWTDRRTGEPCGHPGAGKEYCRPTKRISKRTPNTRPSSSQLRTNIARKKAGLKAQTVKRK